MATKKLTGTVTFEVDRAPRQEIPDDAKRLRLAIDHLEVKDDATYARAGEILAVASGRVKAVEDEFAADKSMSHAVWKGICDRIKKWTDPYREVREVAESKMKSYLLEVDAAKEKAERDIREGGEQTKADLLAQAAEMKEKGRIREARELQAQAESVVTDVVLADTTPEAEGVQTRRPWVGEILAPMELIVAVAEGRFPLTHRIQVQGKEVEVPILQVSEQVVNYYAKKLQKSMVIPGCKASQDVQFARKS